MYCAMVLVYRVPVYIPASEMWMDEARPDYVLKNMMGAGINFIITKVDREGGTPLPLGGRPPGPSGISSPIDPSFAVLGHG